MCFYQNRLALLLLPTYEMAFYYNTHTRKRYASKVIENHVLW